MVVAALPVLAWGLPSPHPSMDGCPHRAYRVHKLVGSLIYIGYKLTLATAIATAVTGIYLPNMSAPFPLYVPRTLATHYCHHTAYFFLMLHFLLCRV